jgi:hypothetical protein
LCIADESAERSRPLVRAQLYRVRRKVRRLVRKVRGCYARAREDAKCEVVTTRWESLGHRYAGARFAEWFAKPPVRT